MSNNLGSVFIIILFTATALLLSVLLSCLNVRVVQKFNTGLKGFLHWNFVIRLIIEGLMELLFATYFNLKYGVCDFNVFGSWVNYFFAILFISLICIAPFFVIIFYWYHFDRLLDEDFETKYGSVYEGINAEKKSALFYMTYFIIRRAIFAFASILLYHYVIV